MALVVMQVSPTAFCRVIGHPSAVSVEEKGFGVSNGGASKE